jgi:hypothetical protein
LNVNYLDIERIFAIGNSQSHKIRDNTNVLVVRNKESALDLTYLLPIRV